MYFLPILRAHTIKSSLRYVLRSNYRNCETIYSFEALTFVRKYSYLRVTGSCIMPLVIEKINLSLKFVLRNC